MLILQRKIYIVTSNKNCLGEGHNIIFYGVIWKIFVVTVGEREYMLFYPLPPPITTNISNINIEEKLNGPCYLIISEVLRRGHFMVHIHCSLLFYTPIIQCAFRVLRSSPHVIESYNALIVNSLNFIYGNFLPSHLIYFHQIAFYLNFRCSERIIYLFTYTLRDLRHNRL